MAKFTTDDVGKAVETAAGDVVGVVTAVDEGTAYVDPEPADDGGGPEDAGPAADVEEVDTRERRELEVDPTEVTDREPEADLEPGEDVGSRPTPTRSRTTVKAGLKGK